jgi:hypothetical protein
MSRLQELARRFDDARAAGELPGVDTLALSRWIYAVCQGISVQARSGARREELHTLADNALAGWPGIRPDAADCPVSIGSVRNPDDHLVPVAGGGGGEGLGGITEFVASGDELVEIDAVGG